MGRQQLLYNELELPLSILAALGLFGHNIEGGVLDRGLGGVSKLPKSYEFGTPFWLTREGQDLEKISIEQSVKEREQHKII